MHRVEESINARRRQARMLTRNKQEKREYETDQESIQNTALTMDNVHIAVPVMEMFIYELRVMLNHRATVLPESSGEA